MCVSSGYILVSIIKETNSTQNLIFDSLPLMTEIEKQNTNPLPKIRHQNFQKTKKFHKSITENTNQT